MYDTTQETEKYSQPKLSFWQRLYKDYNLCHGYPAVVPTSDYFVMTLSSFPHRIFDRNEWFFAV